MDNQLRSFRVLRGDRRGAARGSGSATGVDQLYGRIGPVPVDGVQIQALEFGRVVFKVTRECAQHFSGFRDHLQVELRRHEALVVTGSWRVIGAREVEDGGLLVIEHPEAVTLKPLEDSLDVSVLNRTDRVRVLHADREGDRIELERHFTDLVDFPAKATCLFRWKDQRFEGQFNFEAKSRSLEELHFEMNDLPDLTAGDRIRFEYTFFTVRYVAFADVIEVDRDFGLLAVKFPPWIVALTSRRYDRRSCDLEVFIRPSGANNGFKARLTSCSVTGGVFTISDRDELVAGTKANVTFGATGTTVEVNLLSTRQNATGFSFSHPEKNCEQIRQIYCATLLEPFVIRSPENFALFEKLYRLVGYGPKTPEEEAEWLARTHEVWRLQDSSLPGNQIGVKDGDHLTIAFGILPMGEKAAYGHSLAMDRSLHSIKNFFEVASINVAFTSLFDSVTHYCGSARIKSKFATRIHTVFEAHAKTQTQDILYASSIYGAPDVAPEQHGPFELQEAKEINLSLFPQRLGQVVSLMERPHPSVASAHQIRHFRVVDRESGEMVAWVIGQSAPEYFTAVNIFRIAFCFVLKEGVDLDQIYGAIKSDEFLRNLGVDFFGTNLDVIPKAPATQRAQEDVFWWFFDKEEMGPIIASLSRSAWAVMRKYSADLDSYLKRFVA